jgi:hypothetical protein
MTEPTEHQTPIITHSEAVTIACNLYAIPADVRPAHEALSEQMFKSTVNREALANGYAFSWPLTNENLQNAALYISNERLCCPFFRFEITVEPGQDTFALKLTGQAGVKAFIDAQFNS